MFIRKRARNLIPGLVQPHWIQPELRQRRPQRDRDRHLVWVGKINRQYGETLCLWKQSKSTPKTFLINWIFIVKLQENPALVWKGKQPCNAEIGAYRTITYCLCFYLCQVHIYTEAEPLANNPAAFGKGRSCNYPKFSTEGLNHVAFVTFRLLPIKIQLQTLSNKTIFYALISILQTQLCLQQTAKASGHNHDKLCLHM